MKQDPQDLLEVRELQEMLDPQDLLEQRGQQELLELLDQPGLQEVREPRVKQDRRG